eukprot:111397-Hanusia_phi.AAC.3
MEVGMGRRGDCGGAEEVADEASEHGLSQPPYLIPVPLPTFSLSHPPTLAKFPPHPPHPTSLSSPGFPPLPRLPSRLLPLPTSSSSACQLTMSAAASAKLETCWRRGRRPSLLRSFPSYSLRRLPSLQLTRQQRLKDAQSFVEASRDVFLNAHR